MKDFLAQQFYGNSIQNWLISCAIILGSIVIGKVMYWIIGRYVKAITAKTKSGLDDLLVDKLEEPAVYGLVILGFYWGFQRLTFGDGVDNFFGHLFIIIFTLNITWLVVRTLDAMVEEYIMPVVSRSDTDLDDQLMPIIRRSIKVLLWSMGLIIGLNNAGFDVAALIAGLGIGGLALALAAQDTVKNIFGGIMIFADKPFKMKDRININGMDGIVEDIGVRSTRLRTLDGRLITIPNAQFSDNAVENISAEPARKVTVNLGLTYDTTPAQMDEAIRILYDIVSKCQKTNNDHSVTFNAWNPSSLGILLIYFIPNPDDILSAQTEINMEILRQFKTAGLEFAYPTQTVYKKELQ